MGLKDLTKKLQNLTFIPMMCTFYPESCDSTARGGSRIFIWGGGGKRLCASSHITSAKPNSLSAGVQGLLKGPGSSRVVLMVSRAI